MFDDQINQNNQGGVPKNLPIGEPEDVFANVDDQPASALGAGILTPKKPEMEIPPAPASPLIPPEGYVVKEPALTRGLVMMVLVLIGIGIIAGGGWWVYNSFIKSGNQGIVEDTVQPENAIVETPEPVAPAVPEENVDIGKEITDEQVLFGEPIDKDGDSLDDSREAELGTDPNNWDTDNDQLSDGDEVIIWKTDPKNPDTDGDSYLDGLEVKSGYSPSGPGKIFEPPSVNQ